MPKGRSSLLGIHSNSKKIKKQKHTRKAQSRPKNAKNYKTYSKEQKQSIIKGLRELINPIAGSDYCDEHLLVDIETLDLDEYNRILIELFSQHTDLSFDSLDETAKSAKLKRLRRQVKEWIKNKKKPDGRGGPYIPLAQVDIFKRRLIPVLRKLCCRNFRVLSKKILQICKQLGIQREAPSKHFWYNFLKKEGNEDISAIYEEVWDKKCLNHQNTQKDQISHIPTEEEQTQNSTAFSSPDFNVPEECFGHLNSPFITDFQIQEANHGSNNLESPNPFFQDSLTPQDIVIPTYMDTFEMNLRFALEFGGSSQMEIASSLDQLHTASNRPEQHLETDFMLLEPDAFLKTENEYGESAIISPRF